MPSVGDGIQHADRWRTWLSLVTLVVIGKGLAFLREPVIAAAFGTNSAADAYYLTIGLLFFFYNLLGLPFSLWVTARLAAVDGGAAGQESRVFYYRALCWGFGASVVIVLGLVLLSRQIVHAYAPGLTGARLDATAALVRVGAFAAPGLVLQAVCSGRLFAQHRFLTAYAWLGVGSVVGLAGVLLLTPTYGAAGAVFAFIASWWTTGLGLLWLSLRRVTEVSPITVVPWAEDLGSGVVYRAVAMQVFFQGNGLLVYSFASHLAAGELAAALLASKIIMALYETIVLTAGVLLFPRIARLLQNGDEPAVGRTVMAALNWLVPVTVACLVTLALSRSELVTLVYRRRAFDERATALVSQALLGYAPYIVGITLVEILHRAMVLRGRMMGYLIVFGSALLVNWVACVWLVPILGVMGVALASSIGVVAAGYGLLEYARRRLPSLEPAPIARLIGRTLTAAIGALLLSTAVRSRVPFPTSMLGQLLLLLGGSLSAGAVFAGLLLLLGHRWQRLSRSEDRGATA